MVFYLFLFLSAGAVNSLPFSSLSNRRVIQTRLLSSSDTTTNCYDERQPGIYVLGLQNGKYYVGKSIMNVTARVQEHFLTGGSAWTKLHQPKEQLIPILNASDDLESSERAETLERMWMHGIDNVRGWQYTTTKLNEYNYESIFREMCERKDLCRKCGRQNHMASSCNYRDLATWVEPGRLPNREMILQGGDTRKKKAADRIASMVISDGDNQQKSSQQPVQQQQQQQQSRGGKWNSPNTGMTKQKPTTAVVSAKAIAVESATIGITAVTTNERFTGVGDNVRSGIGPKEQIPRRKETATAITNAAVAATTPQIRKYVSSSSSLPRQSTTTEARITGNIAVDVTANTSKRPHSTPASSFDAVTAVPAAVTAVVMASNGAVFGATAGLTAASTTPTKPNSNKKRLKNDADGNNNNNSNNNNNNKKVTKSRKALWTAATQSFLFNAALACLYRSSASRWVPFSLYHVLLTPILEPQTLLWVQWLDTKVGRGRLKPSLLSLFALFSTVFLVSCWRLVASRELKAIQVAAMVLARSAGQAMLWLPWLTSDAATAAAVVAGSPDDFTAITTTAATATANPNPNNGTRRKQKPNEGRRGTIAASSLTGVLGLLFGWLVGGGSSHVYSF